MATRRSIAIRHVVWAGDPPAGNLLAMPKYVVRYGVMRHLGVFSSRGRDQYARGQRVISRTGRGQELGEVLAEATEHVLSQMPEDARKGQILRLATHDDDIELRRLQQQQGGEYTTIEQRIGELGLDMKLVDVERLYGGERVVVYYLAEERVDFRDLVKLLAKDLQTRVEMRQIGVRDEAKLLADYGDCGKPVCCNTHLSEMPPVSMKMAKLQKATLDPTKISGRCGRLKCCLRYEYDTYREMQQELPKVGHEVLTRDGKMEVLSREILASELLVETEDGRRVAIPASDVLSVLGKPERPPESSKPKRPADDSEQSETASPGKGRRRRSRGRRRGGGEKPPPPGADGGPADAPAPPASEGRDPGGPSQQDSSSGGDPPG